MSDTARRLPPRTHAHRRFFREVVIPVAALCERYRGEFTREDAYAAYLIERAKAERLEIEQGIVVAVATVHRHPLHRAIHEVRSSRPWMITSHIRTWSTRFVSFITTVCLPHHTRNDSVLSQSYQQCATVHIRT